ncbi:MAG: DUF4835 family protein [Crocinitomicaceae bacterium]|nr:DUF4835 family protein [Crocinitomicaceae bacterium]
MNFKHLSFIFAFLFGWQSFAQELNCQVTVQAAPSLQLSAVDKEIFGQMETSIFEFMNNTKWTNDVFELEERINCNILVTITEMPSSGTYGGQIQVQSTRPAYNSSYNSQLFNFVDENFQISYQRNAVLLFQQDQFRNNLTSILAYYAYLILGFDYDSFSLEGGSKWFNKAQQVVLNAQTSGYSGWSSSETSRRNRYWIVDNVLHQIFKPLRKCFYTYHREGLDKLYENPEQARKTIYMSLSELNKVHSTKPSSPNVSIFLNGKVSEITKIYGDASMQEKNQIVNLLKRVDPANSGKYEDILK